MNIKEEEFLKKLLAMFKVEAEEHINILSSGLIELEKKPKNVKSSELVETIFREAHSLKGAARSVNRTDIESICQILESIFSKLKNESFFLTAKQFDLIHNTIDVVSKMVTDEGTVDHAYLKDLTTQIKVIAETGKSGYQSKTSSNTTGVSIENTAVSMRETAKISHSETSDQEKHTQLREQDVQVKNEKNLPLDAHSKKETNLETVRLPIEKLDPLFLQAEQLIQSKIAAEQRAIDLKNITDFIEQWKTEFRKIDARQLVTGNELKIKELTDSVHKKLDELERNCISIKHSLENDQHLLGKMIDEHLESVKKILLLPISTITAGFPKLVRDLARSQKKEVDLTIAGQEIEIDKRILEELKDPLIHLIRNCIDHGIPKTGNRQATRTARPEINITFITVDGRHLEINISDNGSGIDTEKVIAVVKKNGIVSDEAFEKLNDREILDLIFKSGVSTSPIITDLSGRGLGLAIVREKIEKLGGNVSVESGLNKGTTFSIILPLTLSTYRGVLVKTGEHLFFIPTINLKQSVRIRVEDIKTVENRETLVIDQEVIPIVKLSDVLGINDRTKATIQKAENEKNNYVQIIILVNGEKKTGFKVDEIIDEQQILVKELGKQLKNVNNISGATVLGSGKVVPIINVADLLISAEKENRVTTALSEEKAVQKTYRILVTEDSITSRTLIKEILETAGYQVETAVDGIDGYTKILIGDFDLVVSDVDMPRMNGFELTAKIRGEQKFKELPVVLVTALESREDKEHGIDVGANAYIVKSSFDQSNLLEVIKKLL